MENNIIYCNSFKQLNKKRLFITEDKRTEQAKTRCLNVIRSHFNNQSWLDTTFNHNDNPEGLSYIDYMFKQFMQTFYHNPQLRSGATMRLAPLFCKLAFEANFQNNNPDVDKLHRLERILNFIYEMASAKKLDISKISLDATYDQLDSMFGVQIDGLDKEENERMANKEYTKNNEYSIIGPVDFETANHYGNMSCPGSKLCYTQSLYTWNDYTKDETHNVYIVLRNGWDKITPEHDSGERSAYDTYGLSMIFVFVNYKGDLVYCNTRWNHNANYAQGCSCDHAMTREMICDLIGGSFEENFPAPKEETDPINKALLAMPKIPSNYFSGSDIENIVIPNNIISIGDNAFYGCERLTSVTIPDSVTEIGYRAFHKCKNLISIAIPDSVTTIEFKAFSYCISLTSVTIPRSVTEIGNNAFENCSSLTSVTIPDSVKTIGHYAFYDCKGLTNVTIPNSVTTIGDEAFAYCSSLTSITIPDSVTEIGNYVFYDCDNLKSVTIPSRYRERVNAIFRGNPQINFTDSRVTNESINKKRIFITESQFNDLKNLLNEDKRTEQAKTRCLNVIRSHFNNESWLDTTFNHNDNPEGLSYIDYMFKQFMQTFYHNPQLRSGATMRLAPLFCKLAFEANFQNNNPDVDKLHRLERILNFIYEMATAKKLDISKISLDATYEQLDSMFGVQIDGLDKEENERMANKEYTKNNEYSIIGPVDFETAKKYGNMSCPGSKLCYTQSLYTWNDYTKNNAYNVYIVLRNGWDKITPEHDSEDRSAYDTYGLSMIFVFVNSKGDLVYCNTRWNHDANYAQGCSCDHAMTREMICDLIGGSFEENFPTPENVKDSKVKALLTMTEIPSKYFYGSGIDDIVIPNNIISIGEEAFSQCYNLTSVTIPDSVTTIGEGAFASCNSLTSVTIPNSVTTIGKRTFISCQGLTSVIIPNSVTTIEEGAFCYCSCLKNITIPDSVTTIEEAAFAACFCLTSITIPDSVTTIEDYVFCGCSSLTNVTIPSRYRERVKDIFSGNPQIKFTGGRVTNESINKKRIFITESQFNDLKSLLNEEKFYVEPQKVLIVKKKLDELFTIGKMDGMGPNGYPTRTNVIGMKGNNGEVVKNMTFEQALDLLEDKLHNVYTDKTKRSRFLKQVLKDWYNNDISKEGLLSVNYF